MSGDVQPRKRKDKKKKKDDLGFEEPRGTAAIFGDGDTFIHSYHEHGTGGHWCAKIIFFSLLAVLVSLIGLIILENRGLSELEANSVETRYSGVLEGWIEDLPDDDHHDEHTLELKHHDNEHYQGSNLEEEHHDKDDNYEQEESDEEHEIEENNESEESQDNEDELEDSEDQSEEEDDNDDEKEDNEDDENSNEQNNLSNEREESEEDELDNDDANSDEYASNENEDAEQDADESNEMNYDSDEINLDEKGNEVPSYDSSEIMQDYKYKSYRNNEGESNKHELNEDNDEENFEDSNEDFDEITANQQRMSNKYSNHEDSDELTARRKRNIEMSYGDDSFESKLDNDEDDDDDGVRGDDDSGSETQKTLKYNERDAQRKYMYNVEDDEEHEQEDESAEQDEVDIEHIEKEITDEDILSAENQSESREENEDTSKENKNSEVESEDEDFLDPVDDDEPPIERITAPSGAPFVEIEEEVTEKPIDTLADEEEYEKQQEELRREEAEASNMWLKLVVGGALLVATHAVLRRATSPRGAPETEETNDEEIVSQSDSQTTHVAEAPLPKATSENIYTSQKTITEDSFGEKRKTVQNVESPSQSTSNVKNENTVNVKEPVKNIQEIPKEDDDNKELYSDEEEIEEEEEEEEILPQKEEPKAKSKQIEIVEPEEADDVEIIDDEQIEEELDEEDVEEEISDVDDTELLTRLEAKYGRLPEPERFGKHKDGGNSIDDMWPGEPSDPHWRHELDLAEEELRQGAWSECARRVTPTPLAQSARARWLAAKALDVAAEEKRDNSLLSRAITAYLHLLKMNENLPDAKLLEIAQRTVDRMKFRGMYINTEPVYKTLIRRFPGDVNHRNNLTVSLLMANRADLADAVLKETLQLWPNDRIALAHYGFVLKNHYNKIEEAVTYLRKALEGDTGAASEPRFYYHLGDALLLLGRFDEADEVHKRGAKLGHFLSPAQRSLYNVPRLKSRPWWRVEDTPYASLARALEKNWREILKEGQAAKELYEKEKEGLKEKGDWSQLDLFIQGRELPGRCARAPVTCAVVKAEPAAAGCRRGQVKFSNMAAGTHVRPHVGPTNCRLRMHLGLSNTDHTYIRVDRETRQWQVGKTLMFDDSFEHEVWHNGTGARLVLIVDVWHPALTAAERRQLPAI